MTDALPPVFAFGLGDFWIVALMGAVVFGFAFLVGRRFLSRQAPETETEISIESLDSFFMGVTRDRRGNPRRKGNTIEVDLADASETPLGRGSVIDRSQGGLCVLVAEPITEGTTLKVRPAATGAASPWTPILIRSCRKEGLYYELGCQFLALPTSALLIQFG